MEEKWKELIGWEDFYLVSNLGNVKSKDRLLRNGSCKKAFVKKGRILKQIPNSRGYLRVNLKDGHRSSRCFVHRLIAISFIENPENKPMINHIDCNPLNNSVDNLEWCTHQENMDYMNSLGRAKRTDTWLKNLRKGLEKMCKPVLATNKSNGDIIILESVNSSANHGFIPSCVSQCCNNIRKYHKGYSFEFYKKPSRNDRYI